MTHKFEVLVVFQTREHALRVLQTFFAYEQLRKLEEALLSMKNILMTADSKPLPCFFLKQHTAEVHPTVEQHCSVIWYREVSKPELMYKISDEEFKESLRGAKLQVSRLKRFFDDTVAVEGAVGVPSADSVESQERRMKAFSRALRSVLFEHLDPEQVNEAFPHIAKRLSHVLAHYDFPTAVKKDDTTRNG